MPDVALPARPAAPATLRRDRAVTVLAALSWLAALIHAVVIPAHVREWVPYAVCFGVLAVLQGAWAVAIFRTPGPWLLRVGAAMSLAVAAVWLVSRTTGLPFGTDAGSPESIGALDVGATDAELVTAAGALALARGWSAGRVPSWLEPVGVVALAAGLLALLLGPGHAH